MSYYNVSFYYYLNYSCFYLDIIYSLLGRTESIVTLTYFNMKYTFFSNLASNFAKIYTFPPAKFSIF